MKRLALLVLFAAVGCRDAPEPPIDIVPGATLVRGTERLAWSQAGDLSNLRFKAYVDGTGVLLTSATCDTATPEANCTSPLPSLTDGVHSIALTSVDEAAGLESQPTEPITVQKVSGRAAGVAWLPEAVNRAGSLRLETTTGLDDRLAFQADVVARGLDGPTQMASLPDGRLLVAEAGGRIRAFRFGGEGNDARPQVALEPRDERPLLRPQPSGPLSLATHPGFADNHWVYVAYLSGGGPTNTRLHLVQLREVDGTLGDPTALFEVEVRAAVPRESNDEGPRLALGPDGLLYVSLPPSLEFTREPAANQPYPSLIRLEVDGKIPSGGQLSGIKARPLAFAWHPSADDLLVALPVADDAAVIQRAGGSRPASSVSEPTSVRLMRAGDGSATAIAAAGSSWEAAELARSLLAADPRQRPWTVRLHAPIVLDAFSEDAIVDIVSGPDGIRYFATHNPKRPQSGTIVRLTPLKTR